MLARLEQACRFAGLVLLGLLLLIMAGWGVMALWYFDNANAILRAILAAMFALASLTTLIALALRRWRRPAVIAFFGLFALLVLCWSAQTPSNTRDWRLR